MKIQEDLVQYLKQHPEHATPVRVLALIEEIERIRQLKGIRRVRPPHCSKGHELTTDNVYYQSGGTRRCRICTREYQTEYRKKHPEKYARMLDANQEYLRSQRAKAQNQALKPNDPTSPDFAADLNFLNSPHE